MTVQVRQISTEEHLAWIATQPWVSFLQLPHWAALKPGWRHESLGWFCDGRLIGAGLASGNNQAEQMVEAVAQFKLGQEPGQALQLGR